MAGMLGLIASCGDDEVVKLSESDNGTTVNVDDISIIELSLKANPRHRLHLVDNNHR